MACASGVHERARSPSVGLVLFGGGFALVFKAWQLEEVALPRKRVLPREGVIGNQPASSGLQRNQGVPVAGEQRRRVLEMGCEQACRWAVE